MRSECTPGVCKDMERRYAFTPPVDPAAWTGHKYVLDLDGDAASGDFGRRMGSGSVVFKSTIFGAFVSCRYGEEEGGLTRVQPNGIPIGSSRGITTCRSSWTIRI